MKRNFLSIMFLSAMMLAPCFVHAENTPAETEVQKTEAAAPQPEKEKTGWQKVLEKMPKFSGYLQTGWNYNDLGNGTSSFQAKRLRLLMDGNVTKNVSFRMQIEAFNGIAGSTDGNGKKNLQIMDAFATAKIREAFQVRAGQFYLPMGYENYDISPSSLETVDFSNICYRMVCRNNFTYDFVDYGRDLGVMLFGNVWKNEEGNFHYLTYNVSVTNGSLPSKDDVDKSKDVVASVTIRPFKHFSVKGSYNWGEYKGTINEVEYNYKSMNRYIVGAWYNNPNGLDVRAEYGRIVSGVSEAGHVVEENSFYALAGWHLGKFLPVVRYDFYRDWVNRGSLNNYDRVLVGLTYNPCNHVKIQANYMHSMYTSDAKAATGHSSSNQIQLMGLFYF